MMMMMMKTADLVCHMNQWWQLWKNKSLTVLVFKPFLWLIMGLCTHEHNRSMLQKKSIYFHDFGHFRNPLIFFYCSLGDISFGWINKTPLTKSKRSNIHSMAKPSLLSAFMSCLFFCNFSIVFPFFMLPSSSFFCSSSLWRSHLTRRAHQRLTLQQTCTAPPLHVSFSPLTQELDRPLPQQPQC